MASSRNTEMPTFFVIGAAKCGTTSLHAYLDLHPEISMSRVKEPRYFCRHVGNFELPVVSDLDEYLGLFEPGTGHRGESSPAYSESGFVPGVPEAISKEVDDPRFIYLVRDPIERFASAVQEGVASRRGDLGSGRAALRGPNAGLPEGLSEIRDPANPSSSPGRYMTEIRAYLALFPSESILVVDSEDLRHHRREAMGEIFTFLGLEPVFDPVAMGVELNRADEKTLLPRPYLALSRSRRARRALDLFPGAIRSRLVAGGRAIGPTLARPEIDPETRSILEDLYRSEVQELRDFTGKAFASWSI